MRRGLVLLALLWAAGCDATNDDAGDAGPDMASDGGGGLDIGPDDAAPDMASMDMASDGMPDVDVTDMASIDMIFDMASDVSSDGMAGDAAPDMAPDMGADAGPPACAPGVTVSGAGGGLPADIEGLYEEAFDCALGEGGAWFGGVDFTHCFRRADGSGWRIWNTGCGWELGRVEDGAWMRSAQTFTGQCAGLPPMQRDARALTTGVLFDGFGRLIDGLRLDRCVAERVCDPGVTVSGVPGGLPAEMAGRYAAAFDCAAAEGGAWFGGVDPQVCFRKDGTPWRIWNTGCGWQIGRVEPEGWVRYAQTYTGACDLLPAAQREPEALTTGVLYDGFGQRVEGLRVDHCPTDRGCAPGIRAVVSRRDLPGDLAGQYVEAFDCAQGEGGAWFGGVDYTHCFRKADRSGWRLWNTGCGWEVGQSGAEGWQRYGQTYTGPCAELPVWQRDRRGLSSAPLYDGFGAPLDGLDLDLCLPEVECPPEAVVSLMGDGVPADIAGVYAEAFDCALGEGGAWFGGVDFTHCFRREDGSGWLIWNTGCGWEIGRQEDGGWNRYGLTYSGQCGAIPPSQLDARALTTGVVLDGAGRQVAGLRVDHCR